MAPRPLLSIENLSVFHGQFQAIRDLNLDVDAGEIVLSVGVLRFVNIAHGDLIVAASFCR